MIEHTQTTLASPWLVTLVISSQQSFHDPSHRFCLNVHGRVNQWPIQQSWNHEAFEWAVHRHAHGHILKPEQVWLAQCCYGQRVVEEGIAPDASAGDVLARWRASWSTGLSAANRFAAVAHYRAQLAACSHIPADQGDGDARCQHDLRGAGVAAHVPLRKGNAAASHHHDPSYSHKQARFFARAVAMLVSGPKQSRISRPGGPARSG